MSKIRTTSKNELVYVRVKNGNKLQIIKAIKRQIFLLQNNEVHHLIGNIYYTIFRNIEIKVVEELCHCNIQPIILTKFTFRHTPKPKKPSLFKHNYKLKDY